MRCVETFKTRELAGEIQALLEQAGIESRLSVDPMEGIAPALAHFFGVALLVNDADEATALRVLRLAALKQAS